MKTFEVISQKYNVGLIEMCHVKIMYTIHKIYVKIHIVYDYLNYDTVYSRTDVSEERAVSILWENVPPYTKLHTL
jgi:hypothetical protein